MRILVLIRSLDYGGAQRQLVALGGGLAGSGIPVTVATFYPGGALLPSMEQAGVPVVSLAKRGRWDVVPFLRRLVAVVRTVRPTILHGYLDGANLLAALVKPRFPGLRVVWGVRSSNRELERYGWFERAQFRLAARLAGAADLIIVNSHAGRDHVVRHGYPAATTRVIPNGIDTAFFRPDPDGGRRRRAEWAVADGEFVVGNVARFDPMKDHPTFLAAATALARERADVRFVCVGDGPDAYRRQLRVRAEALGLGDRMRWVGPERDIRAAYGAMDVLTLPSAFGEGFPNVVGEAMACGVPCVVTDVGDCRLIVGETGHVVPPRDPDALSRAWRTLLETDADGRRRRGREARERIIDHFGLERLVHDTREALARL